MLDLLALQLQISERAAANVFRLVGDALALPQALRAAIQSVRSRQQLLPLLQRLVRGRRIICVAGTEQRLAVRGDRLERPFRAVEIALVVAESLVGFGADGGGDVLDLEAHLIELFGRVSFLSVTESEEGMGARVRLLPRQSVRRGG